MSYCRFVANEESNNCEYLYERPMFARLFYFLFNGPATTEIYTLSLHDALPICNKRGSISMKVSEKGAVSVYGLGRFPVRSEEHTSELQSLRHLVCRLLLEKKKNTVDEPQDDNSFFT